MLLENIRMNTLRGKIESKKIDILINFNLNRLNKLQEKILHNEDFGFNYGDEEDQKLKIIE